MAKLSTAKHSPRSGRPAGARAYDKNSTPTGRSLCGVMFIISICIFACVVPADDAKPKVAVFPLAGSADQDARDKVGFSLRAKLDRDGHYEPIDGPTMADLAGSKPIDLSATPDALSALAKDESPVVLIWGELNTSPAGPALKLKLLDLRLKESQPIEYEKTIVKPTDLRFAIEAALKNLSGIRQFEHPVEESVQNDPRSLALWAKNPNLVQDGDFANPGSWTVLLRSEKYPAPISDSVPETDKVVIYRKSDPKTGSTHNLLAMELSRDVAESNGLACLSNPIAIEPHTRYRLQFKYRSDGPTLHVFVKGYIKAKDISGQVADLQSYECQVPPSGGTHGDWKTVICDLNPQNVSGAPTFLKVDLYAYLSPGVVMFDDVELKAVGEQTRHAKDDAIKPPAADATK